MQAVTNEILPAHIIYFVPTMYELEMPQDLEEFKGQLEHYIVILTYQLKQVVD